MTVHVDRSMVLPESEYFASPEAKSGIALHHTVCDDAETSARLCPHPAAFGALAPRRGGRGRRDREGVR